MLAGGMYEGDQPMLNAGADAIPTVIFERAISWPESSL